MDIKTIFKWIKDNDKDSCIAYNYKDCDDSLLPEEEITLECLKYFYYEHIKWCGCGCPGDAVKCIYQYLKCVDERNYKKQEAMFNEYFNCDSVYDNPLLLCLAYSIDSLNITEHGTSIGGAWLTNIGKMILYVFEYSIDLGIEL